MLAFVVKVFNWFLIAANAIGIALSFIFLCSFILIGAKDGVRNLFKIN